MTLDELMVRVQAQRLGAVVNDETDRQRRYTAQEGYRRARRALNERVGAGVSFASPDVPGLLGSIGTCWAGKSYSERIWQNTSKLADTLREEVTAAYLSGKSNAAIEQVIMNRFGVGFREAERLVRMETSYVANKAALRTYEEAGLEEYEFLTAKDSRTCKVCAGMDGKRFSLSQQQVGVNAPPMHPFCRCTVLPVVEEESNDKSQKKVYNINVENTLSGVTAPMMNVGRQAENSIEIDELTPCLRKTSTGQIVQTSIERVSPTAKATAQWEFDWTMPERNGYQVFALKAKGDRRVQGMIAMRADAANKAMNVDIVETAPHNSLHNPKNKSYTKAYSGVGGHLFAEAARQSKENGFGGFVYFKSKSDLVDYYHNAFGARLINPRERIMIIDEDAASQLIERYYGGE